MAKKFRLSDGVKRESRRKKSMRVITFIIALIVIAGLVIIFPFDIAAANEADIVVTEDGAGMFTLSNALLIGCGFIAGFLIGELFRFVYKKREKNGEHEHDMV
jgi:hypothetical protein